MAGHFRKPIPYYCRALGDELGYQFWKRYDDPFQFNLNDNRPKQTAILNNSCDKCMCNNHDIFGMAGRFRKLIPYYRRAFGDELEYQF